MVNKTWLIGPEKPGAARKNSYVKSQSFAISLMLDRFDTSLGAFYQFIQLNQVNTWSMADLSNRKSQIFTVAHTGQCNQEWTK